MSQLLHSRYEPLEVIATGGEALVARAWDHMDARTVALKVQRLELGRNQSSVLAEARVLASLRPHVALPIVRDHFLEEGQAVLVLDWVEGIDLARQLHARGDPGLALPDALAYLEIAAAALGHLHRHRPPVVHGDVKPSNLILSADGHVVLVDFGIATGARSDRHRAGTRGYVAPEVAAGGAATPASDIYSLAATAVTLLTGAVPGGGRPDWTAVPPPARTAVLTVLLEALSIDPGARPESAGDFVDRLRVALGESLHRSDVELVIDLADVDKLWARHPDAMPAVLHRFHGMTRETVEQHRGFVKPSGDSTARAIFGDAPDALATAFDLMAAIESAAWPTGLPIRARAALSVRGAVGLENSADGGQVVVSPPQLIDIDKGRPPGWSSQARDGVIVFSRSGGKATITRNTLVGRARETAVLKAALAAACEGNGGAVLVRGDAGIGKTRLAEELAAGAVRDGVTVLWGSCYESGAPALWPWTQAIRTHAAARGASTFQQELGTGSTVVAELVPELASFLAEATSSEPLLIVFDDLHWADLSSILLLQSVIDVIADARLLVVGTYREGDLVADDHAAIALTALATNTTTLEVRGLARDDLSRHVANTLGVEPSAALVSLLDDQTDGNPFFATEMVRLLAAEGRVNEAEPGSLDIPDTVREVIRRRLARLGPAVTSLLRAAAVLGVAYDRDALEAMVHEPQQLELHLAQAVSARVLTPTTPRAVRYRFLHPLLRETVYEDLGTDQRAELHGRAGNALEQLSGGGDRRLEELAYHYTEAVPLHDVGKALFYARRAGRRAMERSAFETGADWFRRALEVQELVDAPDRRTRAELFLHLGDALTRAGDKRGAESAFVAAARVSAQRV